MKFDQEKIEFQPVTITLETEKEVEIMAAILGRISGSGLDNRLIYDIYTHLISISPYPNRYRGLGAVKLTEQIDVEF